MRNIQLYTISIVDLRLEAAGNVDIHIRMDMLLAQNTIPVQIVELLLILMI
ncbi:MAG: hypothetical protein Q619_VDC00501G0002, partial [Veillonella dispar DORA_11]